GALVDAQVLGVAGDRRMSRQELGAVAPCSDLGTQRGSNAHELEPPMRLSQPDVVRCNAQPGVTEDPLALLDRLPTLLEGRQVPSSTFGAHHPEPAFLRIEC